MAQQLFIILQKNRLRQKGLLKRFTIDCYGNQPTIEDLRSLKAQKYEELKTNMKSQLIRLILIKMPLSIS